MNIKKVKTAKKIGYFTLRKKHKNKIAINFLPGISRKVLRDEAPRIYLFTQDGIIKKIGGSSDKGGIKSTINNYVTSMTGSPGRSRFMLHLLIEKALRKKSKVEAYMITSPKVIATVNGLFRAKRMEIASYTEMEYLCKSDYYSEEGQFPEWNYKERNIPYPKGLAVKFNKYDKYRISGERKKDSI